MITRKKQTGFTLFELLIVVAIVATIVGITVPQFSLKQPYELEVAARDLVQAIRFAREESIRKQVPHGVQYDQNASQIKVFELDDSSGTPTPAFTVYHPIDKMIYTLDFSSAGSYSNVTLNSVSLLFGGNATSRIQLHFDEYGTPRYYNSGTYEMLDSAVFLMTSGSDKASISIMPMVGRVTLTTS